MGDGSLSQEEIDALLNMGDDGDAGGGGGDLDLGGGGGDDPLAGLLGGDLGGGGGGGGDINLDSLIGGGDMMGGGGDMDALAGQVTGGGGGGGGGRSGGGGGGRGGDSDNADLLMDVSLRFSVELGRTHMYIKDVLQLAEGSVVELDKNVGDEVDILINDRLFGRGKLIVLDEFFGVQITHVIDPLERFRVM